ncbi:hypothetical protein ACP275_13G176100 [Erythranthe tilingii]
MRAATPATCGQDIDVPEIMLYLATRLSDGTPKGEATSLHAASILNPGAVISGFRRLGSIALGPREVKGAMNGVGLEPPINVLAGVKVAVGAAVDRM